METWLFFYCSWRKESFCKIHFLLSLSWLNQKYAGMHLSAWLKLETRHWKCDISRAVGLFYSPAPRQRSSFPSITEWIHTSWSLMLLQAGIIGKLEWMIINRRPSQVLSASRLWQMKAEKTRGQWVCAALPRARLIFFFWSRQPGSEGWLLILAVHD